MSKAACSTRSSGHTLGSRQASLKWRFTRGTWRSLQAEPVFYIVTGEPFKQSAELTGEPIKMKG
jgi:hypothetical protein